MSFINQNIHVLKSTSLTEFDLLELQGIIELFIEAVDENFSTEEAKKIVYKTIGAKILTQYWYDILNKGGSDYAGLREALRKNLHELKPEILFYCILTEFETNQLFGDEDQEDIVRKLLILTHIQFNIE